MLKLNNNDIVLFQGDSITDGNRGRNADLNHIHGHGYQYILAAKMYEDNIEKNIEVVNRGISGNQISDLFDRWQRDCLDIKPTVLSILVGVNDIYGNFLSGSGSDVKRYTQLYSQMLDDVVAANPDTLIVIMEPFFGKAPDNEAWNKFGKENIGSYARAARDIAVKYNAVFVPLQDVFDKYAKCTDILRLIWDGVHPTTLGHQLIANRWTECVEPRLNER